MKALPSAQCLPGDIAQSLAEENTALKQLAFSSWDNISHAYSNQPTNIRIWKIN